MLATKRKRGEKLESDAEGLKRSGQKATHSVARRSRKALSVSIAERPWGRQVFGLEQCVLHPFARLHSYGVVPSAGAEASDLCRVPAVQFTTRLRHVRAGQDRVFLLPRLSQPLGHHPTRQSGSPVVAMTTAPASGRAVPRRNTLARRFPALPAAPSSSKSIGCFDRNG